MDNSRCDSQFFSSTRAKIKFILISIFFPIFSLSTVNSFAIVDADGDGLVDITTLAQLDAIRHNLAGTGLTLTAGGVVDSTGCRGDASGSKQCNGYELLNDLNFDTDGSGTANAADDYWNNGEGWLPLGDYTVEYFATTFDGNYHEIQNLFINRPTTDLDVGLFGSIEDAVIKNIALLNVNVTGASYVGGLVGYTEDSYPSRIDSSYLDGQITGSGSQVGGLVGELNISVLTNSYAVSTVSGDSNSVGGLVGRLNSTSEVYESYSGGSVSASGNSVGGLIGSSVNSSIDNCFSQASVQGSTNVGGLIGLVDIANPSHVISNTYAAGTVTGTDITPLVGGLVGFDNGMNGIQVSDSHWDSTISGLTDVIDSSALARANLIGNTGGETTTDMQCPTSAGDPTCTNTTIYSGWGSNTWFFRASTEYPTLAWSDDTDNDLLFDLFDTDDDGDNMSDIIEVFYGFNPLDASDALADADSDGTGNLAELIAGTNPIIFNVPNQGKQGIKRSEIAKQLLIAKHVFDYLPPTANGFVFSDVAETDFHADWIEQLFIEGVSDGCTALSYCPDMLVTKEQVAILLLKAKYGSTYVPLGGNPATGNEYDDVAFDDFAAAWIEQLKFDGITTGCDAGNNNYCPNEVVTQDGFAAMLNNAFP